MNSEREDGLDDQPRPALTASEAGDETVEIGQDEKKRAQTAITGGASSRSDGKPFDVDRRVSVEEVDLHTDGATVAVTPALDVPVKAEHPASELDLEEDNSLANDSTDGKQVKEATAVSGSSDTEETGDVVSPKQSSQRLPLRSMTGAAAIPAKPTSARETSLSPTKLQDGSRHSVSSEQTPSAGAGSALSPTAAATLLPPVHRSSTASSIASSSIAGDDSNAVTEPTTIWGVVLVGFNHALGPVVEYSYPSNLQEDEDILKALPFLALPDGAHMHDEDYSCFHLYLPSIADSTVYGISCVRQLRAEDLLRKSSDVTRSTVQKAVVVLANKPIFGPIRDKLGVITRAFFAQRDFEETEILEHFYHSLVHALKDEEQTNESAISMGMSIREIVFKFRMQTLTLFKLLLLQKKVMFYSNQVEKLCSFQYALVSLVPLLLLYLVDAASPVLDSRSASMSKASSLRSSDRASLLAYLGLPLNLFGKGAFFQPYLPLQQMDMLQSDSYLVGATNSIFRSQRDCPLDVIVNLEAATIEYLNPKVATMVGLTAADRKWMDEIVRAVDATWNPADPHRPIDMGYKASDDWLRGKFEEYLTSALSSIKFVDFLIRNKGMSILINPNDPSGLSSFNEAWLAAFRATPAFELWNKHTDPVIFDLVEPKHPCEGQAHVFEDVGIRLVNGLHDLHLDEKLGPTQEAISKGLATGSEGVWKFYSSVKTDLAKRQAEYRDRREKEETEKTVASSSRPSVEIEGRNEATADRPQLLSDHVLAGAAEVGGRAASLATNLGSFFSSRLGKQRAASGDAISTGTPAPAPAAIAVQAELQTTDDTTPKPRQGFFSSFRAPVASSSAAAETLPPRTASPSSSSSSPQATAADFGSFFRRPSSNNPVSPAAGGSKESSISTPRSTSRYSMDSEEDPIMLSMPPDDDVLGHSADIWAYAKPAGSSDRSSSRASPATRNSISMNSDRSDVDVLKDVKL